MKESIQPLRTKSEEVNNESLADALPPIEPVILKTPKQWLQTLGLATLVSFSPLENKAQTEELSTSPERTKIATEVLGSDLIKKYEELGFRATVPVVADQNGQYIIHIGQKHTHPDSGLAQLFTKNMIVNFQEKLYGVIAETATIGGGVVFAEGIADDMSEVRKKIFSKKAELESWKTKPISTLDDFNTCGKVLDWFNKHKGNEFIRNYIDGDLITEVSQRQSKFLDEYQPIDEAEKEVIEIYQHLEAVDTVVKDVDKEVSIWEPANFDSAYIRLYMEGKIDLVPSETIKANDAAFEARESLKNIAEPYNELSTQALHSEEVSIAIKNIDEYLGNRKESDLNQIELGELEVLQTKAQEIYREKMHLLDNSDLAEKIDVAMVRQNKLIFEGREKVALEKINHYPSSLPNYILVYGMAHKFGPELEQYNLYNPATESDKGLIEIKLIEGSK